MATVPAAPVDLSPDPITVPRFTVAKLDTLPDTGQRYELLDGFLLVTPAPRRAHQVLAGRLFSAMARAFGDPGPAYIVAPGVVERGDATHFEPDLLVYPSRFGPSGPWRAITEWWLATEVLSPGSSVYDREIKRDAYLKLGVEVVWLVDIDAHEVEAWGRGAARPMRFRGADVLRWSLGGGAADVAIDLPALFDRIERQSALGEE